jgi:predicted acylesterase/phospholipase RssA
MEAEFLNSTDESEFLAAKEECDLVMKGGVTSGIVYPPVVRKLAKKYRFRNVGGTSAGAIAAAVTAAAEYGRETGGFTKLKALSDKLGESNFLRNLFQPSKETQPLMDTLYAVFIDRKKQGKTEEKTDKKKSPLEKFFNFFQFAQFLSKTLREKHQEVSAKGARRGFVVGLILALLLSGFSFLVFFLIAQLTGGSLSGWSFVALLLLLSVPFAWIGRWLGGLGVGVYDLYDILTKKVPENFFGMCSGRKDNPTSDDPEVLTDWLTANINDLAGMDKDGKPLTFGDLKKKGGDPQNLGIQLKMVTSNLSHNQPYPLPFDNHLFIFKEEDFSKLFPRNVVEYMTQLAYPSKSVILPQGYYFLPEGDDLPVTVAMRMSLSFPILISAVPLYTINQAAFRRQQGKEKHELSKEDLQLNWFSDGGISSNFPIQFFDSWLPSRPTFGIKLASLPPEAFNKNKTQVNADAVSVVTASENLEEQPDTVDADQDRLCKSVYIPQANHRPTQEWVAIPRLSSFLGAIWSTAQNYRDNTQSMLPSYRERVVQVRLSDEEGGLNLSMDNDTIKRVVKKGNIAGQKILDYFKFDHHQWVRFQVLMGLLEVELTKMETVLREEKLNCKTLVKNQHDPNQKYPYRRPQKPWCDEALARIEKMQDIVENWSKSSLVDENTPRPEAVLRVTPEL